MPTADHTCYTSRRFDLFALLLLFSSALVVTYVYVIRVDRPNLNARIILHQQIIEGKALSPYQYRVLVPFAIQYMLAIFANSSWESLSTFLITYAIYELGAIFLLFLSLFYWLKIWFSQEISLLATLFVASTISIALQDHYYQPWSLLEPTFLSISLIAIHYKRYSLLFPLTLLATLNRETGIFIPLALLVQIVDWPPRRIQRTKFLLTVGLLLTWAGTFISLRFLRGNVPHEVSLAALLAQNTRLLEIGKAAFNWLTFLGGFWYFILFGLKNTPSFMKRLIWLVPLYIVPVLIWGVWREVRLLMPLYPLLIPIGLAQISRPNNIP